MNASPSGYFIGKTPSFACRADPRFSYCLYVPRQGHPEAVLVVVHDTLRNNHALRDLFAEEAERSRTLVLAPLFPAGIGDPDELDDYKCLRIRDLRYDELLLTMVGEVAERYGVDGARFSLFGFSGGAHFAHRFLYLQPERLSKVVVAAPGSVTLPVTSHRWWPGLADFETLFGRPVDWDALRRVPTHLVVGARDTDTSGTIQTADHPDWIEGADAAGRNRVERMRSLHQHLCAAGVPASYEELMGAGHEIGPAVEAAIRFFGGTARRPA
jgi:pimeloyl-ACP methyl ester carboxylesterase